MQSQNNRRLVMAAAAAFLILVIAGLVLAFRSSPKRPVSGNSGSYVDKFSHETVSNPDGKAPDTNGTNSQLPVYLGFSKLLDYGLSDAQLQSVESSFYSYSKSLKNPVKQISVDVDHINTFHDSTNPNSPFVIKFKVMFDEKNTYQAEVDYTDLIKARLIVSTSDNKQLYDSGYVSYQRSA